MSICKERIPSSSRTDKCELCGIGRLNAGCQDRYLEEVNKLQPLPEHHLDTMRRERVRVSPGSLVTVHRNYYSVHSRLIGEMVEARVLPDTVETWYADRKLEELPRLRGQGKHGVDYRHRWAFDGFHLKGRPRRRPLFRGFGANIVQLLSQHFLRVPLRPRTTEACRITDKEIR